ncbi:hypothetical protein KJ762_02350 [bacterium]|nr:hypothetical protein [bacterium]MBU1064265.1 hypothetical protein [bacterium]MBU1633333.1 hypothetical protein [bacterium]MBU1873213.1 hypothetical protein [bacterium]
MEKDWKIYSKMILDLRERYLKEKNIEIKQILEADGKSETDRFWDARDKIEKERKILIDCLDDYSRSNMVFHMCLMYKYGMLKEDDLLKFSDEIQSRVKNRDW